MRERGHFLSCAIVAGGCVAGTGASGGDTFRHLEAFGAVVEGGDLGGEGEKQGNLSQLLGGAEDVSGLAADFGLGNGADQKCH